MRDMTLQEWIRKGEDPSTYYCRNRKTPLVLAGLFTGLLRQFYLDPANLYPNVHAYDPTGKCDKRTYIESSGIWKDDKVEMRPAIIVDIGDLAVDSTKYAGMDRRSNFDLMEGESDYEREITGSVVFAHLGTPKGQPQTYASNTYDLFDAFAHAIKKDYCFDIFELRSILKPRLRKTTPEDWECLVQADFRFREGFTVKTEAPKLKTISLEAVVNYASDTQVIQ
jgi:hypothetical protein